MMGLQKEKAEIMPDSKKGYIIDMSGTTDKRLMRHARHEPGNCISRSLTVLIVYYRNRKKMSRNVGKKV